MKEFKGTTPPWSVTQGNESFIISATDNRTIANTNFGWQKPVQYGEITEEEAEANAKLIAAAPDLLEALIEQLEIQSINIDGEINGYSRLTQKAINAVKKALD